jgi:hypothetical protein
MIRLFIIFIILVAGMVIESKLHKFEEPVKKDTFTTLTDGCTYLNLEVLSEGGIRFDNRTCKP